MLGFLKAGLSRPAPTHSCSWGKAVPRIAVTSLTPSVLSSSLGARPWANPLTQSVEGRMLIPPGFLTPSYSIKHSSRHCCEGFRGQDQGYNQQTRRRGDYPG